MKRLTNANLEEEGEPAENLSDSLLVPAEDEILRQVTGMGGTLFMLELSADFGNVLNVKRGSGSGMRRSCETNSSKPIIHGICYTARPV